MERQAECHCGRLKVIATGEPARVYLCHCQACRRRTGTALHFGATYLKERVRLEGERKVFARGADSGNQIRFHFCPPCGSNLYWKGDRNPAPSMSMPSRRRATRSGKNRCIPGSACHPEYRITRRTARQAPDYGEPSMLQTPLCRDLGIEFPILSVGMSWLAGPELVAAVSNAGACGVVGMAGMSGAQVHARISETRALTNKPFGVNVILARLQEGQIEACLDEAPPLIVFFWGDPAPYIRDAHRQGSKVFVQVGSVAEAKAAAEAGVNGVIAQGMEAGGHVRSTTALSALLPAVVDAVTPLPVIASGGIANGRGLVAALSLGAEAVSLGTRFLCSEEAFAAPEYKQRILRSTAEDTVYTSLFDIGWDAPHRVLRNLTVDEWERAGRPARGGRPGEGAAIGTAPRGNATAELLKYAANSYPTPGFTGDIENAVLYAGESCTLIHDVKPGAQIVRDLVEEAGAIIRGLKALPS